MNNTVATYQLAHLTRKELVSELYERYGRKLYGYAVKSWKMNEDESWDMVYQTLYKVIDTYKKYTFENEGKFASFIFRIFINSLRNHYRNHKNSPENIPLNDLDGKVLEQHETHETEVFTNVKLSILSTELEKMEDWQRILLLMRSDGHAYSEIAKYIDKPEEQLKVYYQRLKKILTDKINEQIS